MSDDEHFQRHHTNAFINNILQRKSDGDDKKQKQAIPAPFLRLFGEMTDITTRINFIFLTCKAKITLVGSKVGLRVW